MKFQTILLPWLALSLFGILQCHQTNTIDETNGTESEIGTSATTDTPI